MRCVIATLLLCVSLVASSLVCFDDPGVRLPSGGAQALPSSPLEPSDDGQSTLSGGRHLVRAFMLRGRDGRRDTSMRSSLTNRVSEEARATLSHRSTNDLPDLLWAHTCSVSLAERHVRMQI